MDLSEYEYGKRPYIIAKIFDVHALSNDGFNQYIGPNSYTHKYLDKITPKLVKSFYSPSEKTLRNSSLNRSNEIPQEEIQNENNETFIVNDISSPQKKENNNFEDNKQAEENIEKEKKDFGYKTSNAFFNSFKKSNNSNSEKHSFNNLFMSKTSGNFYPLKSNVDLLNRRLNFTSSNFKRTENPNNFHRFDKNYLSNYNTITKKDFFKNKNHHEHRYNKSTDGFHSYNVPRIESKIDSSKPMNKLAQSIGKSCVGHKKVSYESAYSKAKLKEVMEENEKLKSILNRQTNSHFLKSSSLPDIKMVISQPKLKIKKLNVGEKIKHMGGRYNPYNFQAGRDCETMRRNHVGGLFQH